MRPLRRIASLRQIWTKARRAVRAGELSRAQALRRAVLEWAFFEAVKWTFGPAAMVTAGPAFYPLSLLPDYHGPHFDEALRRVLLPGEGPFAIHLAVTGACSSKCAYCFAAAGGEDAADLGDARMLEIAAAVARRRIPIVNLMGGEPLARFDRLERMVRLLAPTAEVRLATSGIGLTSERAAALREAGLRVLSVSLDSDDPSEVDRLRGCPGAFTAAVNATRISAEAGFFTVVTSVVRPAQRIEETAVAQFLRFVGDIHPALVVAFVPQFATGRGMDGFRTPAAFDLYGRRIAQAIRRSGRSATVLLRPLEHAVGCLGAGGRQLSMDAAGNVRACISGASIGNVCEDDFGALCDRFAASATDLKRGFFCSSVGAELGERVLDPDASLRALQSFQQRQPDALVQRAYRLAPGLLRWLVATGARQVAPEHSG